MKFSPEMFYIGGDEAQKIIASSHIAVFGLGGVGGFCAEALARSGVGELTLVDFDKVSKVISTGRLLLSILPLECIRPNCLK